LVWISVSGRDREAPLDSDAVPAIGDGAARAPAAERYVLRLFVTGMTPRSARAIKNLQAICQEYLDGRYDLDVIDIYQQPVLTRGEQIIAAPTLIKRLPLPMRRLVGDMSDRERVLLGLDLAGVPGSRT
jgi:circadian clock protein KaiB